MGIGTHSRPLSGVQTLIGALTFSVTIPPYVSVIKGSQYRKGPQTPCLLLRAHGSLEGERGRIEAPRGTGPGLVHATSSVWFLRSPTLQLLREMPCGDRHAQGHGLHSGSASLSPVPGSSPPTGPVSTLNVYTRPHRELCPCCLDPWQPGGQMWLGFPGAQTQGSVSIPAPRP
jgi:hypothetical protein